MRILLVIDSLGLGGAENVVVNLADELTRRNHIVKIVHLADSIDVKPQQDNIELISLNIKLNSRRKTDIIKTYFKFRKIVKSFKPDVVHSHLFRANLLSRLLKLSYPSLKVICTEHSTKITDKRELIAYRLTDALSSINTNVSDAAVKSYIREGAVKQGNMVTVVNGVDTNNFYPDKEVRKSIRKELSVQNKKVILAVGRLAPPKDYSNLLNAISILKESQNNFTVLIVGDGELKESLLRLHEQLDLKDTVKFLGIRTDIKNLMQAADVYVMSSMWEGLPMVILEAMACEKMVVATDCGGIKDLVINNGIIVPIKNSQLLAKALEQALNMEESERLKLGFKARQHVLANYSLSYNVDSYLKLYSS